MIRAVKAALFFMTICTFMIAASGTAHADSAPTFDYKKLTIIPICSDAVTRKATWDITNDNLFAIPYMWEHYVSSSNAFDDARPGTTRVYSAYVPNDPDGNVTGFQSHHPDGAWMDYLIRLHPAVRPCERSETILHDCVDATNMDNLLLSDAARASLALQTRDGRGLCNDTKFTLTVYQLADDTLSGDPVPIDAQAYDTSAIVEPKALPFSTLLNLSLPEACHPLRLVLTSIVQGNSSLLWSVSYPGIGSCIDGTIPCREQCHALPAVMPESVPTIPTGQVLAALTTEPIADFVQVAASVDTKRTVQIERRETGSTIMPATIPATGADNRIKSWLVTGMVMTLTYGAFFAVRRRSAPTKQ